MYSFQWISAMRLILPPILSCPYLVLLLPCPAYPSSLSLTSLPENSVATFMTIFKFPSKISLINPGMYASTSSCFWNKTPNSAYFAHNTRFSINLLTASAARVQFWRLHDDASLDKLVGFCSYLRPEYGWEFVWGRLPGGGQGWTDGVFPYNANKLQLNVIHNLNRWFQQPWCAYNGNLMNEEKLYWIQIGF